MRKIYMMNKYSKLYYVAVRILVYKAQMNLCEFLFTL